MMLALLLMVAPLLQGDVLPPDSASHFETAQKENRRVLFVLEQEQESAKLELDAIFKQRTVSRELLYEYVRVDIAEPFLPNPDHDAILRIFSADGAEIASATYADLLDADGKLDSALLLAFLKKHEATPWDALEILEAARVQAVSQKKRLFIHLGAPW